MSAAGYGAIAQAAGSIIGSILQQVAAQKAQREMFQEFQDQNILQKGFATEAGGKFSERLGTADAGTAKEQMATGSQERLAAFANMAKLNLAPTNNLTMTPQDRAAFGVSTKSRARLGSYSDWALKQAIADIRTQQELNRITSFAGGEAGVFPFKMYDAQHKYDWLANLGSAVQGSVGAATNIYNATQAGANPAVQPDASGDYGAWSNMTAPTYYGGGVSMGGLY